MTNRPCLRHAAAFGLPGVVGFVTYRRYPDDLTA